LHVVVGTPARTAPRSTDPLAIDQHERDHQAVCIRRGECLAIAARAGWRAWSCCACELYARPTPPAVAPVTAALVFAAPHPIALGAPLATIDAVEHEQRLDCPRRAECLRIAVRANWPGWSCRTCSAFSRST